MRILGIETSCDETGVAIYDAKCGLIAHALYSQIATHAEYGGVVPELASRDHVQKTIPLVHEVIARANLQPAELSGVAYTAGPGLAGALLVGATIAQSLAFSWQIPAIAVHHLEGHLLAPMLEPTPPKLPFIALLVSGGHTQLIKVEKLGKYEIIGETHDDAVGEAFDKTAKLLGLPYPGGAALARLAEEGEPNRFHFPRPMLEKAGLDFSFSGLKTYAANTVQAHQPLDHQTSADIAQAFQQAVVETLVTKCRRALRATGWKTLVVAGGVGANQKLRSALQLLMANEGGHAYFPRHEFCTDNGAMIAYAGYLRFQAGQYATSEIQVYPRWPLTALPAL